MSEECFALCLNVFLPCNTQHPPVWDPQAAHSSSDISNSQTWAAHKILLPELVLLGSALPSPCTGKVSGLQEGKISEGRCVLWKFKESRICPLMYVIFNVFS